MNKKQAVIILTLLALIVCAGVYAAKINSGNLYVNGDDTEGISSISTEKNTANLFETARLERDKVNGEAITNLNAVIDDKNAPADKIADATSKRTTLTMELKYSKDIENQLKLKGFEDVVCNIQSNTVDLMIKSKDAKLSDKQMKDVESVVLSVAKIKNIKLSIKQ